jgi:hypothetical protein
MIRDILLVLAPTLAVAALMGTLLVATRGRL